MKISAKLFSTVAATLFFTATSALSASFDEAVQLYPPSTLSAPYYSDDQSNQIRNAKGSQRNESTANSLEKPGFEKTQNPATIPNSMGQEQTFNSRESQLTGNNISDDTEPGFRNRKKILDDTEPGFRNRKNTADAIEPNFKNKKDSPDTTEPKLKNKKDRPDATDPELKYKKKISDITEAERKDRKNGHEEMEPELSKIEASMQDTESNDIKNAPQERERTTLRSFGYSFFRPDAQGFDPLSDTPVGPDYLLGSGDRISLTLWGSIDGTYNLEVNRSGEIVIPRIGPLKVSGVTFGQLPKLISGHLGKVFKDFNLSVTMGKLRMIKVYVVGEVSAPGDYSISSLSTVINALSAAGGPTRNGTLRSITIRRNGAPVETVDLYDFFVKGDKSRDIHLQPGDTIFVPAIGQVAGITGNVRRPAIYELKGEKNLKDLLELAGGIIPTGYLQRLRISRVDAHEKKNIVDVNIDPKSSGKNIDELASSILIKDMDLVKIFPIAGIVRDYVRLEGHVLRPGDYALQPGIKIAQVISRDNLLPEYYTEGGLILRTLPPDYKPVMLNFNVNKALAKDPEHNIELHEFDIIRIYSRKEMEELPGVKVTGDVQRPGTFRLFDSMRVRDLLQLAGNPKLTAFLPNAEISRIKRTGASVTSYPININLQAALNGDPAHNLLLEPFDELMVRKIPNWENESDRYVTLKGEFVFPGKYPIYKGERLSAVIERAGGFTNRAFLKGAKFTRALVQEVQQKRMDETLLRAEQELTKKQAELASTAASKEELDANKAALEGLKRNIELLRSAKAEGRVIIRMAPTAKLKKSRDDVELMAGDVLEVPQSSDAVNVLGYVYNPTSMLPMEDATVSYYLDKTGGPTRDAESDEIYIIRADGSVESKQQSSKLAGLFGAGFYSKTVESGDTIVVPQKIERTAWLRNIKDITTIMSQIALTAGTVLIGLK